MPRTEKRTWHDTVAALATTHAKERVIGRPVSADAVFICMMNRQISAHQLSLGNGPP